MSTVPKVEHCLLAPPSGDAVRSIRVKVRNEHGLHVRPATYLVNTAARFESIVTITYKKKTINAKSVLGILLLAAPRGATVVIHALGSDAGAVLSEMQRAFDSLFVEAL